MTDLRPPWLRLGQGGRPVVFHHGVGASLDIFAEWMPLVAARHPVVRFDMRGFGRSVVPPESHEWTMPELIADLLDVAETAFGTGPVHVMGESIGGTIALAAALRHASRFASVAMSNAAINGGQIGYAPGWRAEIARVGIEGWSKRLMDMRFAPGIVRTSLYLNMIAEIARKEGVAVEEIERRYADGVPLKRANEPEDIADMVVFLASPGARNITGQSFNVDGGLILD